MIKSQQIYSPQNYVMAMTGECYIFMHDCDIIEEIHKCLRKHGVEDENSTLWDYPFIEIGHIVEEELDVVLVDISGYGDGEWKTEYRWFEVPEDFSEEEKDE